MIKKIILTLTLSACAISAALANSVTIENTSGSEVTAMHVRYQLAYRNSLMSKVRLGATGWVSLGEKDHQKVVVPTLPGYHYSGIKLVQITVQDNKAKTKTITDKQFPADFGVKRTCSYATSKSYPNGHLVVKLSTDDHKEMLSCGMDHHGYIR